MESRRSSVPLESSKEERKCGVLSSIFKTSTNKIPLTIIYCMVFWNFGICVALFGPTLLDLACQTGSSLTAISWLYFIQNFTTLIGCIGSGMLIKHAKILPNNLLIVCTVMLPICVALMPVAKHISLLGIIMAFLGFNMGCIDNVGNLSILKLHGNNVSPFIQSLHFFYGFGAFVTPIIVQLFLNTNFDISSTSSVFNCYSTEDVQEYVKLQEKLFNKTIDLQNEMLTMPEILQSKLHMKSKTKYAFWILSLMQLPVPIMLFVFKLTRSGSSQDIDQDAHLYNSSDSNKNKDDYNDFIDIGGDEGLSKVEKLQRLPSRTWEYLCRYFNNSMPIFKMTALMAMMVFLFDGLQSTHGGYIYSYAVEKYDLNTRASTKLSSVSINATGKFNHKRNDDAYITASFWAFFSIGRLLSIFIATKFTPSFMILVDLAGCLFSCILMLISAVVQSKSKFLIYFSTCLFGLFLSNTTPSSYSLAEIYIGMTPSLTSFVILNAAIGEILLPLLVGTLFEREGPTSFIIIEFLMTILSLIVFLKFWHYCKQNAKYFDINESFVWSKVDESNGVHLLQQSSSFSSSAHLKLNSKGSNKAQNQITGKCGVKYATMEDEYE